MAFEQYLFVLRKSPNDNEILNEAINTINSTTFDKPSAVARRLLLRLFDSTNVEYQQLASPASQLVICSNGLSVGKKNGENLILATSSLGHLVSKIMLDPLFVNILVWTIIPSEQLERWITFIRRCLLSAILESEQLGCAPDNLWAIAVQFQTTEFVQSTSDEELYLMDRFLEETESPNPLQLAISAMYKPLREINPNFEFWTELRRNDRSNPCMRTLIEREIIHRLTENKIKMQIPRLTRIEDDTSRKVKGQYEVNPYPKWVTIDSGGAGESLGDRLLKQFPTLEVGGLDLERPEILIAGCGTGRHAISTANRYRNSNVLAIDLSRSSLAFAIRQAKAHNQNNLRFAQADILKLGDQKDKFELIEASGVLHHMEDPLVGWNILRGLLKPNGLMRVGLYSKIARKRWEKWREDIPNNLDKNQTEKFIRGRREKIINTPNVDSDPMLSKIVDFYSMSGCRDLLFHAREAQFTLLEIKQFLKQLGLSFLGFANCAESTSLEFKKLFSDQANPLNLNQWNDFEIHQPDTFITMYQFWCQAEPQKLFETK